MKTTTVILRPNPRQHPLVAAAEGGDENDGGRRTGTLPPVWNRESQNVITCEIWTCAGAKVRLMTKALTFPTYEVLIDPYDPTIGSNRFEVSLRSVASALSSHMI